MQYKTEKYLIRLSPELREESEKYAEHSKEHLSEYIRNAISERNNRIEALINNPIDKMLNSGKKITSGNINTVLMKHHYGIDISNRTGNILVRNNINSIEDLCEKTDYEVYNLRNMGNKSYEELISALKEKGLTLKKN